MKVLVEQNKQLSRKLKERRWLEEDLKNRLTSMETQKDSYRAAIGWLHRSWTRVSTCLTTRALHGACAHTSSFTPFCHPVQSFCG